MYVGHLEKCLFLSSVHFLIELFGFWVLSLISSLYILDTNILSNISFADVYSHSVGCFLVLLIVSLTVKKAVILMKSQYFIFAFVSFASGDIPRKKLLQPVSTKLLPMFFSRILWFHLTSFSILYFDLCIEKHFDVSLNSTFCV